MVADEFAGQRFIIRGIPVTKKNHSQIVRAGNRPVLIPSAHYKEWEGLAVMQLRAQWKLPPYDGPVSMKATVYRIRASGDLLNYLAAISDALEKAGVVTNDRWIVSVDGSRMFKDFENPRVEIELRPVHQAAA